MVTPSPQVGENEVGRFGRLLHDGKLTPWGARWAAYTALRDTGARRGAWLAIHRDFPGRLMKGVQRSFSESLRVRGLSIAEGLALAEALDQATRAPFFRLKAQLDAALVTRFRVAPDDLRPWHYRGWGALGAGEDPTLTRDSLFKGIDPASLTVRLFDGIGMNTRRPGSTRLEGVLPSRMDHIPRVTMPPSITEDALREMIFAAALAMSKRYASGDNHPDDVTSLAVAHCLAGVTTAPGFAAAYLPLQRDRALVFADRTRVVARGRLLEEARWSLVQFHFANALESGAEAPEAWWSLRAKYQGLSPPTVSEQGSWSGPWAARPWSGVDTMLSLIAAQAIKRQLQTELGPGCVERFAIGAWMIARVFGPGQQAAWATLVTDTSSAAVATLFES